MQFMIGVVLFVVVVGLVDRRLPWPSALGLCNDPRVAACVELFLVLAGAILYWRAAMEVAEKAGTCGRLASLSAAMIAAFGVLVLFLGYRS